MKLLLVLACVVLYVSLTCAQERCVGRPSSRFTFYCWSCITLSTFLSKRPPELRRGKAWRAWRRPMPKKCYGRNVVLGPEIQEVHQDEISRMWRQPKPLLLLEALSKFVSMNLYILIDLDYVLVIWCFRFNFIQH